MKARYQYNKNNNAFFHTYSIGYIKKIVNKEIKQRILQPFFLFCVICLERLKVLKRNLMKTKKLPWDFLELFRGELFTGEWPTLSEMFLISTKRYPNRPCFTDFSPEKKTLSYREVLENVENLALWFQNNGIKKGDHIAVFGKNAPEWEIGRASCRERV